MTNWFRSFYRNPEAFVFRPNGYLKPPAFYDLVAGYYKKQGYQVKWRGGPLNIGFEREGDQLKMNSEKIKVKKKMNSYFMKIAPSLKGCT